MRRTSGRTWKIWLDMAGLMADTFNIRATEAARGTVKDHLNHLMKDGYLVQHGKGKGTWYSLP